MIRRMNIKNSLYYIISETSGITVYEHHRFIGAKQFFGIGNYDINAKVKSVGNDKISSLKVRGNVKVKLFQHAGFRGKMLEFTAGDYDIDALSSQGFNDQASSMKVDWI